MIIRKFSSPSYYLLFQTRGQPTRLIKLNCEKSKTKTNIRAQISGDGRAQIFVEKLLQNKRRHYVVIKYSSIIELTNELCKIIGIHEQINREIYLKMTTTRLCERAILGTKSENFSGINKVVQDMIPESESACDCRDCEYLNWVGAEYFDNSLGNEKAFVQDRFYDCSQLTIKSHLLASKYCLTMLKRSRNYCKRRFLAVLMERG